MYLTQPYSGVGGGVVGNVFFQKYFGMWGADQKTKNQKKVRSAAYALLT
jgi:hypothetical protein